MRAMSPPSPLPVDRERFLLYAAAIAATGCSASPPPEQPVEDVPLVRIETEPTAEPAPPPTAAEPDAITVEVGASSARCSNAEGKVDCAGFTGPTCEGASGLCGLLASGYGYQPRVAEAILRCWKRLGARVCSIHARKQCNLEAIRQACPEPQYEQECQEILQRCRDAGARITYTAEECVLVLSSLKGGEQDWASGAMGPTREGCRLMYPVY